MADTAKAVIVPRHKMLAFFGVPSASGGNYSYHRMKYFTQFTQNKNAQTYQRQYVDEPTQRTDVTGFSPQIDYGFDKHRNYPVLTDIVQITNSEAVGDDAIRPIILVDTETGEAYKRDYAVVPGTEGDNQNVYTYSGSFQANGDKIKGTAASDDNWQTCTFTESTAAE